MVRDALIKSLPESAGKIGISQRNLEDEMNAHRESPHFAAF